MTFDFKPGSLVNLRNRPWVVLPSEDPEMLMVKPLGGSEEEITGIYKPLAGENDLPSSYDFQKPSTADLGDLFSARLLYNASKLSFRNAAGPFRCLGKLSFRPRAYQMVPLFMALKLDPVRLLIADDVGVGKTIEALMIARELYERKEIKQFAVICLPHLCDQWQDELKNKFGIEAVIIRSGTITSLERKIRSHETIFRAFPFQIISIDYIKSGNKRQVFIDHCPELVIVDEVHSCARPAGANTSQQQRYHLLHDIAKRPKQHMLLLTATPHSGKQEEFQSLLGLLNPDFERIDILNSTEKDRKEIAKHFIQRRRGDIVKWLDEETKFPERITEEKDYPLGKNYAQLFNEILGYARETVRENSGDGRKQRFAYWDMLALLRGVMSSPAAGASMLEKKSASKKKNLVVGTDDPEADPDLEGDIVMDPDYSQDDNLLMTVGDNLYSGVSAESRKLMDYARRMKELMGVTSDHKAAEAIAHVKELLAQNYNPIVFCRYINTANYLFGICKENLKGKAYKSLQIEVVTSESDDETRRQKILTMNSAEQRLLIATDCLSEGINLQDCFNALVHYDLPWNPNRLEQREGRIDRFGQKSAEVKVALLYGSNNPIDGVVLDVLLRKARAIRKSIGISVPFPENSASVMQAVTNAILLKPSISIKEVSTQLSIFEAEEIEAEKKRIEDSFREAEKKEKASRSIFAQNTIKANEIEDDLREVDEAIGDMKTTEELVVEGLRFLGVQVTPMKSGYKVHTTNIPERFRSMLTEDKEALISFKSPTPTGFIYVGRNHPFTEQLCQSIVNDALQRRGHHASRSAVVHSADIDKKTVLFQFRVRNVIAELPGSREIVAEEMWLWGYRGDIKNKEFLSNNDVKKLLLEAKPHGNISKQEQSYWLEEEMEWIRDESVFRRYTDTVALERAGHLVEAHMRYKKLVSGSTYKVVEPVLPMDVLGIYILLPAPKQ